MKILKKWNEHPDKLIAEGEPVDWFETTEAELLRHTEEAGFYKSGSVVIALKEGAQLRTPSAFYKALPAAFQDTDPDGPYTVAEIPERQ